MSKVSLLGLGVMLWISLAACDEVDFASAEDVRAECVSDSAFIESPGYVAPYFPSVLPDGMTLVSHELDSRVLFCSVSGEQWLEVWVTNTWQGPGGLAIQTGCAFRMDSLDPPVYGVEYRYEEGTPSYKKLRVRAESLSEDEVLSAIGSIPLLASKCA